MNRLAEYSRRTRAATLVSRSLLGERTEMRLYPSLRRLEVDCKGSDIISLPVTTRMFGPA